MEYYEVWEEYRTTGTWKEVELSELVGKSLSNVEINETEDELVFTTTDNEVYKFAHKQNCCEDVDIEDWEGEWTDLQDTPILKAEVRTNQEGERDFDDSTTWTFYHFATIKGTVDVRWYGTSNGYYSEEVTFYKKVN